jgi:hypothetical protein
LIGQRLARTLFSVESKVRSQSDYELTHRGVSITINYFIFEAAPDAFDKVLANARPRSSTLTITPARLSTSVKARFVN